MRFAEVLNTIQGEVGNISMRSKIVMRKVAIPDELLEIVGDCMDARIDADTDLWMLNCLVYAAAKVVH